jgi:hypothetical protein
VFLRALNDSSVNMMCLINILLIQALRSGNAVATFLDEVLKIMSRRFDKTIQWHDPSHPVLPSIAPEGIFLNWEKPEIASQLVNATKEMGLAAGLLTTVTPHHVRRGSGRELSRLESISVVPNGSIGIDDDLYMKRIKNRFEGSKDLRFGELTLQEVDKHRKENNMDGGQG